MVPQVENKLKHLTDPLNWFDTAVVAALSVKIVACGLHANPHDTLVGVAIGVVRILRGLQIMNRIGPLNLMIRCVLRVGPLIVPHLLNLYLFTYGYMIIGQMAFIPITTSCLASNNSQHCDATDSHPGQWDSDVYGPVHWEPPLGLSWSETGFGSSPYYVNLSFNNFARGMTTLFVIIIGNNWHVVMNGCVASLHRTRPHVLSQVFRSSQLQSAATVLLGVLLSNTVDPAQHPHGSDARW